MLARLFDADRASLLTRLVLDAVATFDLARLHNDSTSIKLSGAYATADGHERGGKPTPAVKHGFSKDHRPDLKQLVWMLTVTAIRRGADRLPRGRWQHRGCDHPRRDVELAGRAHRQQRVPLRRRLQARDLRQRGQHPHPRRQVPLRAACSRTEDGVFRDWVVTNTPVWVEIDRRPTRDAELPEDVVCAYEDHLPSADGHRIVWIHSTAKARRDATRRHQAITKTIAAIDALNTRLSSPRCRIKTAVGAEAVAVNRSRSSTRPAGSASTSRPRPPDPNTSPKLRARALATGVRDRACRLSLVWRDTC
jgi:hypothetical protein